jgi:hypothetical protein
MVPELPFQMPIQSSHDEAWDADSPVCFETGHGPGSPAGEAARCGLARGVTGC